VPANWRNGFRFAWPEPDREPDEGPVLTWRETGTNYWSGSWGSQPRGTVMLESTGRGVGRFDTVEAAQLATEEVWAAR
jgi:hypothetical protein